MADDGPIGKPGERLQVGLDLVGQLLGREVQGELESLLMKDMFGAATMRRGLENTYGDVWARPGLSRAERSLVTLGALIALRAEGELFQHVRVALRNGLSEAQVDEAIFHASPYVGVVASLLATETARKAIAADPGE